MKNHAVEKKNLFFFLVGANNVSNIVTLQEFVLWRKKVKEKCLYI